MLPPFAPHLAVGNEYVFQRHPSVAPIYVGTRVRVNKYLAQLNAFEVEVLQVDADNYDRRTFGDRAQRELGAVFTITARDFRQQVNVAIKVPSFPDTCAADEWMESYAQRPDTYPTTPGDSHAPGRGTHS